MSIQKINTFSIFVIINILLLQIFVFDSCKPSNKKESKVLSIMKSSPLDSLKLSPDSLNEVDCAKPEIYIFKYSECLSNCEYEKIYSKKYKGDTLLIKLGAIQNCVGKFKISYQDMGSVLNLKIDIKEELVKRKNGKIDTVIVLTECECYYNFEIGIKNIHKKYKTILVNGKRLSRKSMNYMDNPTDTTNLDLLKEL